MPPTLASPAGRPGPRDPLSMVAAGDAPAFALLHRARAGAGRVEVMLGEVEVIGRLADLPLPGTEHPDSPHPGSEHADSLHPDSPRHDVLAVIPYRQIAERGFDCHDDAAPLLAMRVTERHSVDVFEALRALPDDDIMLTGGEFDIDDDSYAETVRRVVADEIGRGEGANFVIRRSFIASLAHDRARGALTIFRRLLSAERGAYWTFVVHCGQRTLVGATPERHVSLAGGAAVMNPISGTYRYPPAGPAVAGVLRFLADRKETDELFMVVDEELKMMGQVCHRGGRLVGPRLREMAMLAHTEYLISGETDLDVREILRATMFAPTVTGSPLRSACRVIARHEGRGRGYYGGVLALIGQRRGARTLDSAILIRTADLTDGGRLEIGVGSTLVRHCVPAEEVAETRAKVAGLLAATARAASAGTGGAGTGGAGTGSAGTGSRPRLAADPRVRRALAARNDGLARFWLAPAVRNRAATEALSEALPEALSGARPETVAGLAGRRILVVDAEDSFTAMLAHQVRALGPTVTIRHYSDVLVGDALVGDALVGDALVGDALVGDALVGDALGSEILDSDAFDAVIVGPGPGDPRDVAHPKIAALRRLTRALIVKRRPFLSVCLGHQVLAGLLGLALRRKEPPAQGVAREIDFFGQRRRVGFYNTFVAHSQTATVACELTGESVEVSREASTDEVHGLRKPGLRSVQFHLESVLTEQGLSILGGLLAPLLPAQPLAPPPSAGGRTRRV